ncbi:hypothetical protein [Undibacterium pigrum]|uniref:Uncharacterized protein n=1 Tax=Undibacterium pigrum TaxID=401470 RepID=A0A318JN03_9BURK|nr:hypothetical protein [Undibacterium pigrum]PXX41602.1 hypothetical protein DFR42_107253 [Undibacterium pigrum]
MRLITNEEVNEVSGGGKDDIQTVTITDKRGSNPGTTDQEKRDISAANGGGGGV